MQDTLNINILCSQGPPGITRYGQLYGYKCGYTKWYVCDMNYDIIMYV